MSDSEVQLRRAALSLLHTLDAAAGSPCASKRQKEVGG